MTLYFLVVLGASVDVEQFFNWIEYLNDVEDLGSYTQPGCPLVQIHLSIVINMSHTFSLT